MGTTNGRLIAVFDWTARLALVSLCVGFVATSLVEFFPGFPNYSVTTYLGIGCFWLTILSLWLYLVSMFARESVERIGVPYRFSVRSLLLLMTAVATVLGAMAYALRR